MQSTVYIGVMQFTVIVHARMNKLCAAADSIAHHIPCSNRPTPGYEDTNTLSRADPEQEVLLERLDQFLRLITFEHISIKPVFASLSGKPEIARAALSTYSCARARVCSMPSLLITISRA